MDSNNVKKRDVMGYDDFINAYDQVRKTVPLKAGKKAHPGARDIKAEGLFYRHDANVYNAAGIPIPEEKDANIEDKITANQVNVQDAPHDGQDPLKGASVKDGQDINKKITDQEKKDIKNATTVVAAMSGGAALEIGTTE